MAKLERRIENGNFDRLLQQITEVICQGSISASIEESSYFQSGTSRCAVRVFERYSVIGGNRLSLSVTLFQGEDGDIRLSAISSGGSQGIFFKVNRWGEEAFLDEIREIL
ncbi:MAG: hypothetical protein HFE73_01345 [Firmicutes bacterium]|nr:hypothetical protein [Bacillota bacterium]